MNNAQERIISTYDDLLAERKQLETLIDKQKNLIRHDLDEIKNEFKKEIKPAIEAGNFIKKLISPETRNRTIVTTGASIIIDLLVKKLLGNSNLLARVLIPTLLKNYSSYLFNKSASRRKIKVFRKVNDQPMLVSKQ